MTKLVSLTDKAYQRLLKKKEQGESFSDVVARLAQKDQSGILELAGSLREDAAKLEAFKKKTYRNRSAARLRIFG
jgi:predicted CopG family antitoxin